MPLTLAFKELKLDEMVFDRVEIDELIELERDTTVELSSDSDIPKLFTDVCTVPIDVFNVATPSLMLTTVALRLLSDVCTCPTAVFKVATPWLIPTTVALRLLKDV